MPAEFDAYVRRATWVHALDPRVKLAFVVVACTIDLPVAQFRGQCGGQRALFAAPRLRPGRPAAHRALPGWPRALAGLRLRADRAVRRRRGAGLAQPWPAAGDGGRGAAGGRAGRPAAGPGPDLLPLAQHDRSAGAGQRLHQRWGCPIAGA